MADPFQFELVSPERLLMSEPVDQVVVPGSEGYFTVLKGHAPFMSTLRPGVVDVTPEYRMEEIDVSSGAPGAGRPLAEVAGPAIVAALRRAGGELVPQPPRDIVVEPGDVLIVMGTDETIDRLEALFTPERRS